jgi:tight adherence protein C
MLLFLIALGTTAAAAYFAFDAVTYPAQQRRSVVRRAATYGQFKRKDAVEQEAFRTRALNPLRDGMAKWVLKLNPRASADAVDRRLLAAGLAQRISATTFLALKGGLTLAGLALGFLLGSGGGALLFGGVLALIGYKGPDIFMIMKIRGRKGRLRADLPDALDLLAVSVEAGLGFDGAILKIMEHMKGPLAEEFALTLGEMRVGQTRQEALKNLAERTDLQEVSSFTRAIIQADQLGISLGRILRVQAADSRVKRQAAAEEKAMKAPIKMMFPTAIFIFPVIFIVSLAPAFLNIGDVF